MPELRKDIYRLSGIVTDRQQNGNLPGMRSEALEAAGIDKAEQDRIIAGMQKAAKKQYSPGCVPIPAPENTVAFDVNEAFEQLKKPQVQAEIRAILNGGTE